MKIGEAQRLYEWMGDADAHRPSVGLPASGATAHAAITVAVRTAPAACDIALGCALVAALAVAALTYAGTLAGIACSSQSNHLLGES